MHGAFFKGTRAGMAVQALAIVVRLVELDVLPGRRRSDVVDIDMP